MRSNSQDIQLHACLADPDAPSEYRFLVDEKNIKYITIEPGVIPPEDISFEPALKSLLPAFPPGEWNEGLVVKDKITGSVAFARTVQADLPSVRNIWNSIKIDHLQLTWIDRIRQNIRLVTCPLFKYPIVYKFAAFPWQIPITERETTAYSWIYGQGIGPRFLGHVTEAGRVIGFLMENVPGRTAQVEDLDKCQRVLRRLHALQFKHGDVNKHNFLVSDEKDEAVLIDFETTVRSENQQELVEEFEGLRDRLEENDGRGGILVEEDDGGE